MEIGGGTLHSSEDDRLSADNIRISTTPTFHIQNFTSHSPRRNSSAESLSAVQRDVSQRSHSSLSHINPVLDEKHLPLSIKTQNAPKSNDTKFLCPNSVKKEMESISLPGTLRKIKKDSTRGSNNCYVKNIADLKLLTVKIEKGCPKSHTIVVRQASDDEYLLSREKTEVDSDPGDTSYPDIKIQIDSADDMFNINKEHF